MRTVADALRPVALRALAFAQQHQRRNCGEPWGVTFTGAGLMVGDCRCECCGCAEDAAPYACPTCRDVRYVRTGAAKGEDSFGRAMPCPRCFGPGSADRVAFLERESGIRPAEWARARTSIQRAPRLSAAQIGTGKWLASGRRDHPFLTLWGSTGTTKTTAAIGVADVLIREDIAVRFTTAADFIAALKATFNRRDDDDAPTAESVVYPLRTAGCAILDDLGAEHRTAFTDAELLGLLDARLRAGALTVITTNLDPGRVDLTDRMMSRLFGDRHAAVVDCFDRDFRFERKA